MSENDTQPSEHHSEQQTSINTPPAKQINKPVLKPTLADRNNLNTRGCG